MRLGFSHPILPEQAWAGRLIPERNLSQQVCWVLPQYVTQYVPTPLYEYLRNHFYLFPFKYLLPLIGSIGFSFGNFQNLLV